LCSYKTPELATDVKVRLHIIQNEQQPPDLNFPQQHVEFTGTFVADDNRRGNRYFLLRSDKEIEQAGSVHSHLRRHRDDYDGFPLQHYENMIKLFDFDIHSGALFQVGFSLS
jgi:hypothetical protein